LRNIHEDSLRLTTASAGLVAYLDQTRAPETGLASPQEEVEGWLEANDYHFAGLERAASADPQSLIEGSADLVSVAARELALDHLRDYRADVLALPLPGFLHALAQNGANPMLLAQALSAPMPLILRRLASLPREHAPAGLGLIGCDGSGTLTFRRAAPGFVVPRFGAACSLWPLYEALVQPGVPIRRVIETAGRGAGVRYVAHAWCERGYPGGFDGPAVSRVWMLILPLSGEVMDAGSRPDGARVVGASCRICPKTGCVARREPSILT
jgi:predicted transcriptional regulator